MYLPHEVELSHTWLLPGILFLPRKHIQIKTGKLAKNPVVLAIDPMLCLACLETQALFVYTGWHFQLEPHSSAQEVLKQSSAPQPCQLRVLGDTRAGD